MKKRHQKSSATLIKQEGFQLFLCNIPFLILVFLLSYLPIRGWLMAFVNYKPGRALMDCDFVGLANFAKMFRDKYAIADIWRVLKNTFAMNFLGWLFSPIPMIFAIFLSDMRGKYFKKAVQTLTTLPHFISWVLVYAVAYSLFSVGDGLVNKLLMDFGLVNAPINFLIQADGSWIKMALWGLWKSFGWSAILYFAAITSIDQELYEAARVDGAGRFRLMWHITIPHLLPTFFVLLILSIASFLDTGMEQYYLFSNAMNKQHLEVLDLYVYNLGIGGTSYSFATAVSILKSIVGIVLLVSANGLSKWLRGESIL